MRDVAERTPAPATGARRSGCSPGCVQRAFFGDVNAGDGARARRGRLRGRARRAPGVLRRARAPCRTSEQARAFARQLIATFERDRRRRHRGECGRLRVDDEGVRSTCCANDPAWAARAAPSRQGARRHASSLAAARRAAGARHPMPPRVAYHDACHLAHAQGVRARAARAAGGDSGTHARCRLRKATSAAAAPASSTSSQPAMAAELGHRKAGHIADGRRRPGRHVEPGLHPADPGRSTRAAARPSGSSTSSNCWTPRFSGRAATLKAL